MTSAHPVPQLRKNITGHSFGGQYESEVDIDVVFTESDLADEVTITLRDTLDTVRHEVVLTLDVATQVHTALDERSSERSLVPGVVGLETRTLWSIGDDSYYVDLRGGDLDEVQAWLRFATGVEKWTDGDDWEY